MELSDFKLLERGPYLFDTWQHCELVSSPLGDFAVELLLEMGEQPTPPLLAAAEVLVARFALDKSMLAQKVFDEYLTICGDAFGPEWLVECGVPEGLSLPELAPYLDPRMLTVDSDLTMTVYTSPDWDREHGIYFNLLDGTWERSE